MKFNGHNINDDQPHFMAGRYCEIVERFESFNQAGYDTIVAVELDEFKSAIGEGWDETIEYMDRDDHGRVILEANYADELTD